MQDASLFQVCWVVADIDAAERDFATRFGEINWLRMRDIHFSPESCSYRGAPADFTIHVWLGYSGGMQIELIQPVAGASLYVEYLDKYGPGLHHVAWVTDDLDAVVQSATAQGIDIPQRGDFGDVGMDFAYLDGGAFGGYVEVMQLSGQLRSMFDELIPEGRRNPWRR